MKTFQKVVALALAIVIMAGLALAATAVSPYAPIELDDEIQYTEAVELFSNLEIEGSPITDVLGGSNLGGKARQALTYNEGVALINALHTDGRTWQSKPVDESLTFDGFFVLVDKLLCTENWFGGLEMYTVYLNKYLAGFEDGYDALKDRPISREEALQVLMNAMSAKVRYGITWYLGSEYGLTWETSTDNDLTDDWCRPVRRWIKNGTPITQWYTMPALMIDDASICTHDMLERVGILDWSQDGGFSYNPWCMFDICANGGTTWSAAKLHWNHRLQNGCHSNWLTKRPGSRLEIYYMGEGTRFVPDAGSNQMCQLYQAIVIDEYLAYVQANTIKIFASPTETWSWTSDNVPRTMGYNLIHLNLKHAATAIRVASPKTFVSPQKGMELPSSDGNNYVYTQNGKIELSNYCVLGLNDIINSMDYYYSGEEVVFLLDSTGRVIGAYDPPEKEWDYQCSMHTGMSATQKQAALERKRQEEINQALNSLCASGVLSGSDKGIEKNASVTNAMVWKVLARLSGYFPDESTESVWYAPYQHWAISHSIGNGKDPNAIASKEEIIQMIFLAAKGKAGTKIPNISDYADVSSTIQEAVRWAVEKGVIEANGGKLNPHDFMTRGELALLMMKAKKFCN